MKFPRSVKNDLILFQGKLSGVSAYDHLALVNIEKFPEVMGLPTENKIVCIFKIVDGVDPLDRDILF